ncbi:hypothetical protein GY45DRAFT_1323312, partial [Cubamyces sp. BRFM 1775]
MNEIFLSYKDLWRIVFALVHLYAIVLLGASVPPPAIRRAASGAPLLSCLEEPHLRLPNTAPSFSLPT